MPRRPFAPQTGGHEYGDCPECFTAAGLTKAGPALFGVCHDCKTYWPVHGDPLPDFPWDEWTDGMSRATRRLLDTYREVSPVFVVGGGPG